MNFRVTYLIGGALLLVSQIVLSANPTIVQFQTTVGTIAIQPNFTSAPITANNFIKYVDNGFYKNTLFHRMSKNFVLQGGGVDKTTGKFKTPPFAAISLESNNGLHNVKGTIAMARTSVPNSATSQFFINTVDNLFLDYTSTNPGYAVFGTVVKGMNLVTAINNYATYNTSELPYNANGSLVWIENTYKTTLEPNLSRTRISRSGSGTVTSFPAGINCGTTCYSAKANKGTLQLTATPSSGNIFSQWRGDCQGASPVITLDLSKGDHLCTAVFISLGASLQ